MSKIPKIFLQIKILYTRNAYTHFTISKQDIDLNTHFIEGHKLYEYIERGVRFRIFSDCFPAIYGPNCFNDYINIEFYIRGIEEIQNNCECRIPTKYFNILCNAIIKFNLKLNNTKFTNKLISENYRDLFIIR